MRALARRVVFDADLADDVEQETWLAALEHAPRDLRDPRAWLARVARHAARKLGALQAHRNERELRTGAERASEGRAEDPSGLIEREDALRSLLAAVRALPEPVRRAVVLHYLDGLTLAEVAVRTGAPLETVRSRVKRGLELLRAQLARARGSRTWSLFLVRALELAPPSAGRGLALAARHTAVSLLVMSTTSKLAVGTVALLALTGFFLLDTLRREPATPPATKPVEVAEGRAVGLDQRAESATGSRLEVAPPAQVESAAGPLELRSGALALQVVWADDRTPAGGVPVRLQAPAIAPAWSLTNPEGRFEREHLPAGVLAAQTLFGGLAMVSIEAGETSEAVLEIPAGIAVLGRVETAGGEPVAAAELFLSPGAMVAQYDGWIVARTDARGEFALRTAPSGVGACLSARAAGFAPSEQVILSGPPRSQLELTLVLEQPGRALTGVVLAPDGQPVAGAEVLVGSEREWIPRQRGDGLATWAAIGELARTDEAGHFALAGIPSQAVAIQVRAQGHPAWRGEIAPDAAQPIAIRLERGAAVSGSVRSANGAALEGVRVRVEPASGFGASSTTSAADGSYRLAPLAPGTVELAAERAETGLLLGGAARASQTLELSAGADLRWDPVLPLSREFRGRIEAPGLALEGWTVRGWRDAGAAGEPPYVEEVRSDASGRFVLAQPPEGEIGLALFARGGAHFPVARLEHVATGGPEVVLRPDPARVPSCAIAGALVDASGEAVRSADIVAESAQWGRTLVHPDPEDGSFEIGPLPAGEWTLAVDPLVAGWAVTRVRRVLAPSQRWDAGAVRVGPGGTLAIRLALAPSSAPDAAEQLAGASAQLVDLEQQPIAWLAFVDGAARSSPIAPGTYRLVLGGSAAGLAQAREVVIVAGEETAVELELALPVR